jgi:uncharacterized protein
MPRQRDDRHVSWSALVEAQSVRAYLDIETAFDGSVTVVGIYRAGEGTIQLVGGGVNDVRLYEALDGVSSLVTFNGTCFDLPVLRKRLFADLKREYEHCDLMYVCRRRGLRGGLKLIEQRLGIARATAGVSGWDAPRLWQRYETQGDEAALKLLLHYNWEDVVNLARLEACLNGASDPVPPSSIHVVMS